MKSILIGLMLMVTFTGFANSGPAIKMSAPPSIWARQDGENLTGPVVDLVTEIFDESGVRTLTKILPWARAIEYMKTGELDLMLVIFKTPERSRFMAFSIPYVEVPTAVFVPPGNRFAFSTLSDLKGRQGVMMQADSISSEFDAFRKSLSLTAVSSYAQIFSMLAENRADYAVAAQYGFMIQARRLGCQDAFEKLKKPVATRNLHFAFSKKSPYLKYMDVVNKRIRRYQENGRIQKMVESAIRQASE